MLSPDAVALLDRARHAAHAVELYLAPGATRLTADRLVELLGSEELLTLDERALWNLLFAAGELSVRVDVYRAHALFLAVADAVSHLAPALRVTDPRAAVLEMSFHFLFARRAHPLVPLRSAELLARLGALLGSPARVAVRASIHGLGHAVALGADGRFAKDARQLLLDHLAGPANERPDDELRRYAEEALSSRLR